MLTREMAAQLRMFCGVPPAIQKEIADEIDNVLDFLEIEGYRRCDIPACNCGRWHCEVNAKPESSQDGSDV